MKIQQAMSDNRSDAERISFLRCVLPLWPHEISDRSLAGQQRICRLLASALRRERQRGVAGHWAYDVARHSALARALPREMTRLARLTAKKQMPAAGAGMALELG